MTDSGPGNYSAREPILPEPIDPAQAGLGVPPPTYPAGPPMPYPPSDFSAGPVLPPDGQRTEGGYPYSSPPNAESVPPARSPRRLVFAIVAVLVVAGLGIGLTVGLKSSPAPQSIPGTAFTDADDNFTASFPCSPPSLDNESHSFDSFTLSVRIAHCSEPYVAVVEVGLIDPALPADQMSETLHAELAGVTTSSSLVVISESATTLHGYPARVAHYRNPNGPEVEGMSIGHDPSRLYLLLAPSGAKFDALVKSLVMRG